MTELVKFYNVLEQSNSEASRVSDNVNAFADPFKDGKAGDIEFVSERDNDIFNRGVVAGSTHLVDTLQKRGYAIETLEGEPIIQLLDDGPAFSEGFLSGSLGEDGLRVWTDPNT